MTETVEQEVAVEVTSSSKMLLETEAFSRLTKKNQQYLVALDRHLSLANLSSELRRDIYQELCETLIEAQHTGQTARQLYGTPIECAETIMKQYFPTEEEAERSPDLHIAIDGALLLGSIFTLITGFSVMRVAQGEDPAKANMMGLVTLIINYFVAGGAMLAVSKVLPKPQAPKGEKGYVRYFAVSTAAMLVWILAVTLSNTFLPMAINPILPYELYFIIGGLTFALKFYLKRKWNIRGGIF